MQENHVKLSSEGRFVADAISSNLLEKLSE